MPISLLASFQPQVTLGQMLVEESKTDFEHFRGISTLSLTPHPRRVKHPKRRKISKLVFTNLFQTPQL